MVDVLCYLHVFKELLRKLIKECKGGVVRAVFLPLSGISSFQWLITFSQPIAQYKCCDCNDTFFNKKPINKVINHTASNNEYNPFGIASYRKT